MRLITLRPHDAVNGDGGTRSAIQQGETHEDDDASNANPAAVHT